MNSEIIESVKNLGLILNKEEVRKIIDALLVDSKKFIIESEQETVKTDLEEQFENYNVYSRQILEGYAEAFNTLQKIDDGNANLAVEDLTSHMKDEDINLFSGVQPTRRAYYLEPIILSKYIGFLEKPILERLNHSIVADHATRYETFKKNLNMMIEKYRNSNELVSPKKPGEFGGNN